MIGNLFNLTTYKSLSSSVYVGNTPDLSTYHCHTTHHQKNYSIHQIHLKNHNQSQNIGVFFADHNHIFQSHHFCRCLCSLYPLNEQQPLNREVHTQKSDMKHYKVLFDICVCVYISDKHSYLENITMVYVKRTTTYIFLYHLQTIYFFTL